VLTRRVGFRGRDREFDQLTALLARAAAGTPFAIVLAGEGGIGKSRLVEEVTHAATGLRVLRGKASELERERPFGPLFDALGLRTRDLADADSSGQFAVADHLLDLLEREGDSAPVVLVVEDVHWADPATLSTLARLARQRGPLNTSLLCTRRPSPRGPLLEALLKAFSDEGGAELLLGPLDDASVDAIVGELAGAPPGPTLSARVRGAAGNPLYVTEFVEGLAGELARADGVAEVSDSSAPPSLPLTIMHRLGLLPVETIELLRTAAVLGASFPLRELSAVARRTASELVTMLQPAIDGGVVVATEDGFRFRHDLIHEAAYADIPASVRKLLHADAAKTLTDVPQVDATHVARHFELGCDGPDAATSDWLWRAAEVTSPLDPRTGLDYLVRSVARTPTDHPELQIRRLNAAYSSAVLPGQVGLERARAILREPLPDRHRWGIEDALVTGLALAGDVDAAEQLAFAERRAPTAQISMTVAIVGARCFLGDPAGAERVIKDLVPFTGGDEATEAYLAGIGGITPDDARESSDFCLAMSDALVAWARGENAAGPALARRWEGISRRVGAAPRSMECAVLIVGGDSGDRGWRDWLRRIGSFPSHALPEIDTAAGFAHFLAGDWDDALAHFEASLHRVDEPVRRLTDHLLACAAVIEAHRGNADAARVWRGRSETTTKSAGVGPWAEAALAESAGDLAAARRLLEDAWRHDENAGVRVWQRLYATDLVRLAIGADDALAAEVVAVVESLVARGGEVVGAAAKHCRALTEHDGAGLVEAAELYRSLDRPVEAARAEEDAAVALTTSDAPRARQLCDRARAVYEALGSQRDLARLARRLSDAGMTRKAAPRPRPATGWDSLTESERRVAELVSHGLTYGAIGERLYVSRRTVETHVAHVFLKLGVGSKAELASAYVARHGA
jgi:DNA-binding CsgD family transcriptional regulator